jgi:hypothetical protein
MRAPRSTSWSRAKYGKGEPSGIALPGDERMSWVVLLAIAAIGCVLIYTIL